MQTISDTNLATSILEAFASLEPREEWSFRTVGRAQTNSYSHGYHRYPAKFIPQIVRKLVETNTSAGDLVCDIFGGCGTTLVESKIMGRRSIGFDINPVAKLIAQVKVTPIEPALLQKYREEYVANTKEHTSVTIDHHPRLKYWFDADTLQVLDHIYPAINKIRDYRVRRFFLCAFSHNLKTCSRWLMKSIKPTVDKSKAKVNPETTFLRQLDFMIRKNESFHEVLLASAGLGTEAKMYRRDSTKKLPIPSDSIDLVVSSPPYVTSYEYADLHQLSLLWFAEDQDYFERWHGFTSDYETFRKTFVGTGLNKSHRGHFGSLIGTKVISQLRLVDSSVATDVSNYFVDMHRAFVEIHRILRPGARACIIIGNTCLNGVNIPNAEVTVEEMSLLGFTKVDYIKREVPNKKITPWRDSRSGKFTSLSNPDKKRAYDCEYIVIMEK